MFLDLVQKHKKIHLVGLKEQPKFMMERIKMIPNLIPNTQIFENFEDYVNWTQIHVKDEH